jgi:hypothetical protein
MMESVPIGCSSASPPGRTRRAPSSSCAGATAPMWSAALPARPPRRPGSGVAMITAADEAISVHQRVAETAWRDALKGATPPTRCARTHPPPPGRIDHSVSRASITSSSSGERGAEAEAADEGEHRAVLRQHLARHLRHSHGAAHRTAAPSGAGRVPAPSSPAQRSPRTPPPAPRCRGSAAPRRGSPPPRPQPMKAISRS